MHEGNHQWEYYSLEPIIRLSDRFKLVPEIEFQRGKDDKGFVSIDNDSIYFGVRDIKTLVSSISGEYKFTNKIAVSLWARHYWQKGKYSSYLFLDPSGGLNSTDYIPDFNPNYNYNSFNIDLVFGWEFSPGSMLNVVWKNALQNENQLSSINYLKNFDRMISSPKINNLSVKVVYYLDYQMLRKNR